MEKKFDVTLKSLLEDSPADWSALADVRDAKVSVIDADIATISGAADKVLLVGDTPRWILHFEFQSGPDASLPRRMNVYNGALEDRHSLPVESVAILLAPQADLTALSGTYEQTLPHADEPYRVFRYQVIRVWKLQVERLLHGGLACLALAPIAAVKPADLPNVVREMKRRISRVEDRGRVGKLWTAAYVLMGMRYEQPLIDELLQEVMGMKESVTYQAIIAEGRTEGRVEGVAEGQLREARNLLFKLGEIRFKQPPSATIRAQIEKSQHLATLERQACDVLNAKSWEDLFPPAEKSPRRKPKGR